MRCVTSIQSARKRNKYNKLCAENNRRKELSTAIRSYKVVVVSVCIETNTRSTNMSSKSQVTDGLRSSLHGGSDTVLNNRKPNDSIGSTSTANKSNGEVTKCIQREHSSAAFMKIKTYLLALRPWSLSASLVPTILGSALSYRSSSEFNFITFLLTIFTVITVHGAGNVVNTYYDYVKGIDNRKSDDRTLVDHILSKDEVGTLAPLSWL